jgi:hypothetical protein
MCDNSSLPSLRVNMGVHHLLVFKMGENSVSSKLRIHGKLEVLVTFNFMLQSRITLCVALSSSCKQLAICIPLPCCQAQSQRLARAMCRFQGLGYKASVIGTRLSPAVAVACVTMAVVTLFF